MCGDEVVDEAVEQYERYEHVFARFLNGVVDSFSLEPGLHEYGSPVVHSIKSRKKDKEHLRGKILRKRREGSVIDKDNIFDCITDLAGVRVLHLYQDQLPDIHNFVMGMVDNGDWRLYEPPVAYSWDPESQSFFEDLGLNVKIKDSYYTSIHYVVMPANDDRVKCEVQVRTLFEEIWGEIDHTVNYPKKSDSTATREQLKVLSKLVSTGTRLADSIFRVEEVNRKAE